MITRSTRARAGSICHPTLHVFTAVADLYIIFGGNARGLDVVNVFF